jgi:23S rRNA (uracil1939-C5)-methyltransferase
MTVAELAIDAIAAGGDGVARQDGMVVFVPRTAPGDRVRARVEARHRFARGTMLELLTPSAQRTDPLCYHYRVDDCGGCQLQHMRYEAQLAAKATIIRDAMTRIGARDVPAPEVVPSPKAWRYRRKLTLAMRRRPGEDWVIGLHPFGRPDAVFQLSDCPITDERVVSVWRQVMEARRHFPPADELRASVQLLDDGDETSASVVMEGANRWPERSLFFAAVPAIRSLWWKPAHRPRSLVAQRGEDRDGAAETGAHARAAASFAQVNADVGAALHAYVVERALDHRPDSVIDAYAGSGATAVPIAQVGPRVVAIESDRDAAAACAAALPPESRAVAARVEDVIGDLLPADVVLLNPPRAGVHETVSTRLEQCAEAPRAIIYVSCDPATLARDVARLPRYRIESLRAFDMFPQTAHVETVCELVPERP